MELLLEIQADDALEIFPRKGVTIEWDIHQYNNISKKADAVYRSKHFNFAYAVWQFQLYPNGQRANQSVTWLSLYLVRIGTEENKDHSVHLDMSIKSKNGGTFTHFSGSFCYNNTSKIHGWSHFIKASELQRNWFRVGYPQGVLKISCDITEDISLVDVASQTSFVDGFKGLSEDFRRLLKDEQDCDLTIKVQDREFHAHRLVLEARSSVFKAMFEHDMKENSSGIINIDDCDPDIFQEFLTFIYAGKFEKISSENACGLFVVADKYNVGELKQNCLMFMKTSLSVDIVCEVMAVADRYDEKELMESARKLIIDNFKTLLSTEQWCAFMKDHTHLASEIIKSVVLKD